MVLRHPLPRLDLKTYIKNLPRLSPREMFEIIEAEGYIGQERARKAICLLAYRHLNRLRKLYVAGIARSRLPTKENCLLIGPTGCGKTFLIELLFQKVLHLPTVIIDITAYSETGYIGQDVPAIITRLIHTANNDIGLASIGIICIDEFDKIASGHNSAVFSGQGTTKDVTGAGVQRELLKMLEASEITVPLDLTHATYSDRVTFNTADVPFIACGAFSGFRKALAFTQRFEDMGFNRRAQRVEDRISVSLSREEVEKAANFEAYGLKPELIGRFARIIPCNTLSREDLKRILHRNTIRQYMTELELDGIQLAIDEAVYDLIVDKCVEKETGARGLKSLITEYLEEACFEVYSAPQPQNIKLFVKDKTIQWDLF